jgi:hypothetical protein
MFKDMWEDFGRWHCNITFFKRNKQSSTTSTVRGILGVDGRIILNRFLKQRDEVGVRIKLAHERLSGGYF